MIVAGYTARLGVSGTGPLVIWELVAVCINDVNEQREQMFMFYVEPIAAVEQFFRILCNPLTYLA